MLYFNFDAMSLEGIFPIEKWDFHTHAILSSLPPADHALLMVHAREEKYSKGQVIFREGARPGGIYYIREGKVKKYKIDNFGKEQIIYVANSGELIGYHAILAAENYPDSAATLEASTIVFIPTEDFIAVLNQSPVFSRLLLSTLSHEFGVLINNISVFAQRPVRERIAIALIILREKYKEGTEPGLPVVINVSRDTIANMTGTTRENVARFLTDFKNEGIIETIGRKILITNIRKLVAISNYE